LVPVQPESVPDSQDHQTYNASIHQAKDAPVLGRVPLGLLSGHKVGEWV
jgi:hypothetical protein